MFMSRRVTNGSGLIMVGQGGEHTFRHIFTNKNGKKINANFALMHEKASARAVAQPKNNLEITIKSGFLYKTGTVYLIHAF